MRITHASVFVSDQAKALEFYTEILGFVKKQDLPLGKFRWLTVVSPDDLDGTELLLEPDDNPVSQAYQKGIFAQGIPAALFSVEDVSAEHRRLQSLGVVFKTPPTEAGGVIIAAFDDTCGNLIQIVQA
ncbi:VOC family protein [Candidatus Saccharibacteria bacterium]|nr:VOC family protein [Candidatus Saccharibacteria bacterium]